MSIKTYVGPELVAYGDIARITGVFGPSGANDVFIDNTGTDISDTTDPNGPGGSMDACASADLQLCLDAGASV